MGLSADNTQKARNIRLLKERDWMDILVVYNNHRRAIFSLQKGLPGERVFSETFQAWKQ